MKIFTKKTKREKFVGFLRYIAVVIMTFAPISANSNGYFNDYYSDTPSSGYFETVYTDTPVASYYAYPDDVNFVPEAEFMQRTDSLDYDDNIIAARDIEYAQRPGVQFAERPAVICRNMGCTRLNEGITRTFLFNSLTNMFMMNSQSRAHICEADPFSRSCLQSGITLPARVGIANAMIKIPKASIGQVDVSTGLSKASVGLTYELQVNGITRQCDPTYADIFVPAETNAVLSHREFACNMTSDGMTNVSLMLNIDYIDLDYGIIGGYYSLGMQGPTSGGGTGYMLMKTEYSNRGMTASAATGTRTVRSGNNQMIRPGEYAVAPCKRIEPMMPYRNAENNTRY